MLKAIIVDDEKWARNVIRNFGQWDKLGIEIVGEAESGKEGLDLIMKHLPDIVITDMEMSNMNGVELLQSMKDVKKDMKVIVISGYDDFTYMKQAIISKAFEYLLKPVDAKELNSVLKKCVDQLMIDVKTSTITIQDMFDKKDLEKLRSKIKDLAFILLENDFDAVKQWRSDIERILEAIKVEDAVKIRLTNDYVLPIVREHIGDDASKDTNLRIRYESYRAEGEGEMESVNYLTALEGLIKDWIEYRKQQIKESKISVVEQVKDYIDETYRQDISLSNVAKRFFTSKEYLSSAFKSKFGFTIGNYILEKKMEEAARMVDEGKNYTSIAESLSYKDLSYFYKVFKKYHGCTPKDYENRH